MPSKITKGKFIDLGDEEVSMPVAGTQPHKWYPSLRIRKAGIKKGVGQVGTALVKFRVRSVELREGQPPETCLELTGIKEQTE